MAGPTKSEDVLYQPRDLAPVRDLALADSQARIRDILRRLSQSPPQTLLIEGGTLPEREAVSLYWALVLNCSPPNPPCLDCPACQKITRGAHRDFFFLDGAGESIKIDTVRALRPLFASPPREAARRVVILNQAQNMRQETANALLKSLEEPVPYTVFVLLAPQRERLLPTLVSRSFVLTLAWPDRRSAAGRDPAADAWLKAFEEFLVSGRGLMAKSLTRGEIDLDLARKAVVGLQRELASVLAGEKPESVLAGRMNLEYLHRFGLILSESLESLDAGVNPPLVLDRLAVSAFALAHSSNAGSPGRGR